MGIECRAQGGDGSRRVRRRARQARGRDRGTCCGHWKGPGSGREGLPVEALGGIEARAGQTAPVTGDAPGARGKPRGETEDHRGSPAGGARGAGGSRATRRISPCWQTGHTRSEIPVSASETSR